MTTTRPDPRGHNSPLVEAITQHKGEWTIHDSELGVTNNDAHVMWIPLDDEFCRCGKSHSAAIRGHELLHSKLSPKERRALSVKYDGKTIKVSEHNVMIAEEYRMNHSLLMLEGYGAIEQLFCPITAEQAIGSMMDKGEYQEVVRYALCGPRFYLQVGEALGTYVKAVTTLKAKTADPKILKTLEKKLKVSEALIDAVPAYATKAGRLMSASGSKYLPSWKRTEELAAFLEVNLANLGNQIDDLLNDEDLGDTSDFDTILSCYGEVPPPESKDLKPKIETRPPTKTGTVPSKDASSTGRFRWGKNFETTEAPMPKALPSWKIQRKNRAVDEGTTPRYMHRYASDKRVFHRTKKIPGGSILVDDSGSMGLSSQELDALLEQAPVATVAIYAGGDGQDGGEIRVVAQKARRAAEEDLSIREFHGNGIDMPALEWLATQPYPRIWVSDGLVVGVNGNWTTPGVMESIKRFCVKNRITRAPRPEDAVEMLKTGKYMR